MNRKREEFKPKVEGRVGMYVCGVTAYDLSHIGHARVYVTFDVLNSYLRHLGYEVDYVRNFTDVDDKVFDKMSREMTDTGFPGAACPDFMWNDITGHIPMEIGDISSLGLLVLNGNKLSGSIPEELGNLSNLRRLQIDENNISGPIPKSFANLSSMRHLHMNNNSISGQIPPELSNIYTLFHL